MTQRDVTRLVIYGDFNCPFSALAGARVERLAQTGRADVDWRAVEHDPEIPVAGDDVAGEDVHGELAQQLDRELEQVRGLLLAGERIALRRPAIRANTSVVTARYAAVDTRRRATVRSELFRAYWTEGKNLADPDVLAEMGLEQEAPSTVAQWRREWRGLDRPIVPMMILPDGTVSRGLGALTRLADLSSSAT